MPIASKAIRPSAAKGKGSKGKQQKLSFKHKVSKAINTGKGSYKSPPRTREYLPKPSPEPENKKLEEEEASPATDNEKDHGLAQPEVQAQPKVETKSEAELRASEITDREIQRYWDRIEASRNARAVHKKHTEGLATGEKVLRYFDVSSQYGPCIGISRIKRWERAQRLGLNPPLEALAVLLKEEAKGNEGIEKAHMDVLLNSTAVGSVGV
ncbi:DNA polymerase delta, subunit 4-domain-containing protein [Chaetomium strumarium]|uniref:DNA polymerase delta, subunit 4-domain-containing protein n=1 Tax=Chaetomium strumarium TaxID=1170767 RepID=A0AAJ0M070_9PEZI|nr:DNA polymerase delta, subunit 4-domain-containing protein [Chaetomium strumarium]